MAVKGGARSDGRRTGEGGQMAAILGDRGSLGIYLGEPAPGDSGFYKIIAPVARFVRGWSRFAGLRLLATDGSGGTVGDSLADQRDGCRTKVKIYKFAGCRYALNQGQNAEFRIKAECRIKKEGFNRRLISQGRGYWCRETVTPA